MNVNVNQHERDDGQPAAPAATEVSAVPAAPCVLVPRDHDEQLLAARLVTSRHPDQWISAAPTF